MWRGVVSATYTPLLVFFFSSGSHFSASSRASPLLVFLSCAFSSSFVRLLFSFPLHAHLSALLFFSCTCPLGSRYAYSEAYVLWVLLLLCSLCTWPVLC